MNKQKTALELQKEKASDDAAIGFNSFGYSQPEPKEEESKDVTRCKHCNSIAPCADISNCMNLF